jgi:hypothetical protein
VKIDRVWACLRLQIVDAAEEIVGMAGHGVCRAWTQHAVMRNGHLLPREHVARGGFDAGDQLSTFGHLMLFVPGLPGGAVPLPARIKVSTYASRSRLSDSSTAVRASRFEAALPHESWEQAYDVRSWGLRQG